jgi:LDH2 family malate/lactate/ureidoglycolate dehydrogenase
MRVDAFRPVDEYKSHMDHWIRGFRSATPIDETQPVLVPGDPEREAESDRMVSGIPLMDSVVVDLNALSQRLGVPSLG